MTLSRCVVLSALAASVFAGDHSQRSRSRRRSSLRSSRRRSALCSSRTATKEDHGKTDHYGLEAGEKPVHIHDWHAAILHLLGLDHEKRTYRYAGREMRLTDMKGSVVTDLVA